jgi:hypothetical protein
MPVNVECVDFGVDRCPDTGLAAAAGRRLAAPAMRNAVSDIYAAGDDVHGCRLRIRSHRFPSSTPPEDITPLDFGHYPRPCDHLSASRRNST